ncbi:sulfotransferase 1B1-like isoform X2 [Argopecten irradians]|uniref:sulfotransferase 1B1-like isoform X2 n=1 Tax=Argopecten irradians TaxID=31199 RepID=UPI00371DA87D
MVMQYKCDISSMKPPLEDESQMISLHLVLLSAGTHWGFDILYMLQNGKAEYNTGNVATLDFESVDKIEAIKSPRILVSHFYPQHIPRAIVDKKCKIVYIYRNPKDTAVSMHAFLKRLNMGSMKIYNGTWEHFVELFITQDLHYNSWFEHVKSWVDFKKKNPDVPILILSFEDMKLDLRKNVQKMAEFLGSKQNPEFLDEVASKCQFGAMSKAKSTNSKELSFSKDGSNPIYRKGEVGDWKNWFTDAQNEMFDKILAEKMAGIDLEVTYSL